MADKFRSEPLQNMRAGDTEPWMGRDYSTPEDFVQSKQRYLDRAKIKQLKVKVKKESNPDQVLFSFENPQKRFTAPAFAHLEKLAKNRRK